MIYSRPEPPAKILIVDDDEHISNVIRSTLGGLNHRVEYTASVVEAQKAMVVFEPDLILLDCGMPGKNGLQFLSEIRKMEQFQFLPVVILTGAEAPGLKLAALKQGATDFLRKPFSGADLAARVENLLKQKFLTDELEVAGNVLSSMAETIEARDPYTRGHCTRVANYVESFGSRVGLSAHESSTAKKGAFFHDFGKIAIRDDVLLKPGPLTAEEFRHIQTHPVKGFELLKGLKTMRGALPIIRHHHEKLDGSGYPDGISGTAISTLVRIVSIADIFDALTTDRVYRKAFVVSEALDIMKSEVRQGWWDPDIFAEFKEIPKASLSQNSQATTLKAILFSGEKSQ